MEIKLDLKEIAEAAGASCFAAETEGCEISEIVTDSRKALPGSLFVAVKGERTDGHLYLEQAVKNGASALMVEKKEAAETYRDACPVLLVRDTAEALGAAARLYRDKVNPELIAVTGSVGKTSTRDLIAAALGSEKKLHRTRENLNNLFGVPYTLLDMPRDTEIAVIECGMDRRGELSRLSRVTAPDMAVLTNIGTSHIERLGSRTEILCAKAELLDDMKEGGAVLINGEDPYLLKLAEEKSLERPFYFVSASGSAAALRTRLPEDEAYPPAGRDELRRQALKAAGYKGPRRFRALPPGTVIESRNLRLRPDGMEAEVFLIRPDGSEEQLPSVRMDRPAPQQAANMLFALLSAVLSEVSAEKAARALAEVKLTSGRQEFFALEGGGLLLDDCYNASPESMKAAFALADGLASGEKTYHRKAAVLGGVNELGDYAEVLHRDIGRAAGEACFDVYYLLGPQAETMAAGIRERKPEAEVFCFEAQDAMIEHLRADLMPGMLILVKASRGYALEHSCRMILDTLGSGAAGPAGGSEETGTEHD